MPCTHRGRRGMALHILNLHARLGWVVIATPRPFYPRKWPQATHCRGGRRSLWASLDGPGVDTISCTQRSRLTSFCRFRHWIPQYPGLLIVLILAVILICQLMLTGFCAGMYWNVRRKWAGNRKVMVRWRGAHSRDYPKQNINGFYGDVFRPRHCSKSTYLPGAPESVVSFARIEHKINNKVFYDVVGQSTFYVRGRGRVRKRGWRGERERELWRLYRNFPSFMESSASSPWL